MKISKCKVQNQPRFAVTMDLPMILASSPPSCKSAASFGSVLGIRPAVNENENIKRALMDYYLMEYSDKGDMIDMMSESPMKNFLESLKRTISYDEYKTVVLGPLLMYVNGIFSVEDFDLNEVIIPKISYISDILAEKFPEISPDNLEVVNW